MDKHGHSSRQLKTPTYESWRSMKTRCFNPNTTGYYLYGGRGVTVCERWLIFENFLADMGERPEGMSIDRFPNKDGNYEPSNCRWATETQQKRNTRRNRMVEIDGVRRCMSEWREISGIKHSTLMHRLKTGWNPRDAVFIPADRGRSGRKDSDAYKVVTEC